MIFIIGVVIIFVCMYSFLASFKAKEIPEWQKKMALFSAWFSAIATISFPLFLQIAVRTLPFLNIVLLYYILIPLQHLNLVIASKTAKQYEKKYGRYLLISAGGILILAIISMYMMGLFEPTMPIIEG